MNLHIKKYKNGSHFFSFFMHILSIENLSELITLLYFNQT